MVVGREVSTDTIVMTNSLNMVIILSIKHYVCIFSLASLSQCSRIPVYLYIAAFALQNKQDHLQLLSTFRNFFIYKSLLILRYHIPVHPVLSAMIYQSLKILALED